jgi:hypothetical protein
MLTTIDVLEAAATLGRSYRDFRRYVQELLAEGKATGSLQTESRLQFTVLNEHRQNRLDKTIELIPELRRAVKAIRRHQTWMVLSEGWCGDSAQALPVLSKIEEASDGNVDLKILVAAENPELMNRYLTNGKRSVPKLIIFDTASGEELAQWGPRPEMAELMAREGHMALYTWYANDRTIEIQKELAELMS